MIEQNRKVMWAKLCNLFFFSLSWFLLFCSPGWHHIQNCRMYMYSVNTLYIYSSHYCVTIKTHAVAEGSNQREKWECFLQWSREVSSGTNLHQQLPDIVLLLQVQWLHCFCVLLSITTTFCCLPTEENTDCGAEKSSQLSQNWKWLN